MIESKTATYKSLINREDDDGDDEPSLIEYIKAFMKYIEELESRTKKLNKK